MRGWILGLAAVLVLSSPHAGWAGEGGWTPTGSLGTARGGATATPPTGQVLIAGGHGTTGALTSAELYSATICPICTLTVTTEGTGSGMVNSEGGEITCPDACAADYETGSHVTLTAAAAAGSSFTGWGEACTGTGACLATMDGPRTVTAIFSLVKPTVTVAATDATATEAGLTTGTFTFTRTGSTAAALRVYYSVSGTATPGSDYPALGTAVTIPSGASVKDLVVTPINDALIEPPETVLLTLVANAAYTLGSPASATVTIESEDVASILGTYLGSGSMTQAGCTDPRNNGTYPLTTSVTIASQVGASFTGTASLYTTAQSALSISGTLTPAGQLSGTFSGSVVGRQLTVSFSGRVTAGETCSLAGSLTATR